MEDPHQESFALNTSGRLSMGVTEKYSLALGTRANNAPCRLTQMQARENNYLPNRCGGSTMPNELFRLLRLT